MTTKTKRRLSPAERAPLQVLIDFTDLALMCPPAMLCFLVECVPPNLTDDELGRLDTAAH